MKLRALTPRAQLERVWKATVETTNGFCDAPEYAAFLAAVRDVNANLPSESRLRVLGVTLDPEPTAALRPRPSPL